MTSLLKKILVFILTLEARIVLMRHKPKIIAVTGSVGKTSTKDAIYAALSGDLHVRKSEKSLNSEFGVPLTILGCETGWRNPFKWLTNIITGLHLIISSEPYPKWLILEVGADRPGDIARIAKWLRPDIAVITSVPEIPAHVEYFESADAVAREKKALAQYLKPDGKLILNGDEERTRSMRVEFRGVSLTYGIAGTNDFSASHVEIAKENDMPIGMQFRIERAGSSVPTTVHGVIGRGRMYSALAACAVAEVVGLDLISVSQNLSDYTPTPGRMRILSGVKETAIIDDTYNSSPEAAYAAVDVLKDLKGHRRIAVLGDMLELGRFSGDAHRALGERLVKATDLLVVIGIRAKAIADAAIEKGFPEKRVRRYAMGQSEMAGKDLIEVLKKGDVILVKGSQGMRMERTVKAIMAEPEYAESLLVRQDEEWLAKV